MNAAVRWMVLASLAAASGCAGKAPAAPPPAVAATPLPATAAAPQPGPVGQTQDRPVTHLGRTVLPRTDVIVRGRLTQLNPVANGAEVGRLVPEQWLRGDALDDGATLVVLSAAYGTLPAAGREALFLLATLRTSDNLEVVDVATLDDEDGAARLRALQTYLRIEAEPDPAKRVASLRGYLAGAIGDEQRWTRWNAAREFAALGTEVPDALTADDRPVLERALGTANDRTLRDLIQTALAACPDTRTRGTAGVAAAAPATPSAVAEASARFDAAGAAPAARRQAVVDAAVAAGPASMPLVERALGDADATVREAAVAAVGQLRLVALEPKIASMLVNETSSGVRRTLIAAAGYVRSVSSVPTLGLLAKEGSPFAKEAAFALARIRSEDAIAELRRQRAATTDGERADLLEFLVSDRFVAQERALGEKR